MGSIRKKGSSWGRNLHRWCSQKWVILAMIWLESEGFLSRSKCPDYVDETGRVRSNCQQRGLINIVDLHLDADTRVLDLSDNELKRLSENQFQVEGLTSLEELLLQKNLLNTIDPMTFNGLSRLHLLDLSQNHISTLALAYVPPLRSLNLSQNYLSSDFNLRSTTLEDLDLSYCSLRIVPVRHYSELPGLHNLNLSFNQINKLPVAIMQHMPLRFIQLYGNQIECNEETSKLIKWFDKSNVHYKGFCPHQSSLSDDVWSKPSREMKPPILIQRQNLQEESSNQLESQLSLDECLQQVQSMRNENRLFALITLSLHLAILVAVLLFFGLYLSHRCKDSRKREGSAIEEEESGEDVPPPPYRTRSNLRGFHI